MKNLKRSAAILALLWLCYPLAAQNARFSGFNEF